MHAASGAAVSTLPATRLEFGLSNLDVTWMTGSGVPWRYRYQYLSAGVNTGSGWETWQNPALPPGQFAVDFMSNSSSGAANYIPVFTYYELLQSNPHVGSTESDRDFSNLNNAATMSAYYANFSLLMQKAGAYQKPVVVHVEPDFWGYMQQLAGGGSASAITAMVKSSGFAAASAFPDNLVGFASELKYLRDTYAPNVLLAMHASMWSSGIDVGSTTDPAVNAAAEADKTAAFLNSAGMWDLVFNDVDDHDAAWWELASCGSPPCVNQYFTHWWDTTNSRFPNFSRYLAWVAELHAMTSRQQVVWQVPVGNQYFLTMNNTCGHYQDNVAPYFIAHASDLFNAGLVAVLFGSGNQCQTTNDDSAAHDGITNNGGKPTTDLLGGCSACNTATSVWPDDDGGYLRTFVGLYYAGCKSATVVPAPGSFALGATIAFTAGATGCTSPEFEYWVLAPGGSWQVLRPYSSNAGFSWSTSGLAAGTYQVAVWVRQHGDGAPYYDVGAGGTYTLTGCTSASLTPTPGSFGLGSTIAFTATAAGCSNPEFEYWVLPPGGYWQLLRAYGAAGFSWNTAALPVGTYQIAVWARQNGGGTPTYETGAGGAYVLTGCTSASVTPVPGSFALGSTIAFTASASGCSNPEFEYWVLAPGGYWQLLRAYGAGAFSWNTSGLPLGTYQIAIWARQHGGGTPTYETAAGGGYTLTGCSSASLTPPPGSFGRGTTVSFTAGASGCSNPEFEYWVLAPGGYWQLLRGYGTASFNWNTSALPAGTYQIAVWARQQGSGTATYEAGAGGGYTLS